jgi:hypothetical protein
VEFKILKVTKQDSFLIAITLGIMVSMPFVVPAFHGLSTITLPNHDVDRQHLSEQNDDGDEYGDARSREPGLECGQFSGFSIQFRNVRDLFKAD